MEKSICPACTGETVVDGYCHNCGAGTKPEVEEDTAPVVVEEEVSAEQTPEEII